MPGGDAVQVHSQTPPHQQDQLGKSTHFNLIDSPRQAGSFPHRSQPRQQSLFDVLTCPPQASYTLYLCWIGRERKNSDYFFKPICCLALKCAVSSLERTFSVILSLPGSVVAHSRVPLPSLIITCCSSETPAA